VEDSLGRIVTVPRNPQRIVSLTPSSLELIRLMGKMDKVVGVTNTLKTKTDIMPEVSGIPSVGKGSMPNIETIAMLNPDLVIAWGAWPGQELEGMLGKLGISVMRLDFYFPYLLEKETRVLSEILGDDTKEKAEAFLNWNMTLTQNLESLVRESGKPKPTVIVELYEQRHLAGKDSSIYWTTLLAGADNLCKEFPRKSVEVDAEWVINGNPDYYLKLVEFASSSGTLRPQSIAVELRDNILMRPGWNEMKAIKEGKVFIVDSDISGGPRDIVGAYTIANWLYPELISSSEASRINSEYYTVFQNLPKK
jgi:iron complex transport system substrate-binding protein